MKNKHAIPLLIILTLILNPLQAQTTFTLTTDKSTYYLGETITITITGATPNGHVMLQLNSPTGPIWVWEATADNEGKLTIKLKISTDWTTGTYTLYAKDVTTKTTATHTITITTKPPPPPQPPKITKINLQANTTTIKIGQTITFTAQVLDQTYKPMPNVTVQLIINQQLNTTTKTNTAGKAVFQITFKVEGNYTIYAQADTVKSNEITITVTKPPPPPKILTIKIEADKTIAKPAEPINITATITDQNGNPQPNIQTTLYIQNAPHQTKTTNNQGQTTFTITLYTQGNYTIYAKTNNYTSNTITITVKLPPPKVTILMLGADKLEIQTEQTITFTAIAISQYGTPMKNTPITLYINNTPTQTKTTQPNGKTTFTITFQQKGTYQIQAKADNTTSNTITITVKQPPPPEITPTTTIIITITVIAIAATLATIYYLKTIQHKPK